MKISQRFQEPEQELSSDGGRLMPTSSIMGLAGDLGEMLAGLFVVLVGVGSVGFAIAQHLARLGVGRVALVDPKSFKRQSLLTHQGLRPEDVGGFKARVAAQVCASLHSNCRPCYFIGAFQELSPVDLAGADAVLMSPDNLAAEHAVGQQCLHLGIPLIHAAVHGQSLVAAVRVYANAAAKSPTPACGFSRVEREMHDRQVQFSCEGPPAASPLPEISGEATNSVSFLCSIAADLAVTQLLRHLLDLGEPVGDSELEWCGFTHRTRLTPIVCRGDCRCDHARFTIARAPRPLSECSPAELSFQADAPVSDDPLTLALGEYAWAERGVCTCGRRQAVARFVRPAEPRGGPCPRCGGDIVCPRFFLRGRVPVSLLGSVLDRPFGALGAAAAEWAQVRSAHQGTLFLNP